MARLWAFVILTGILVLGALRPLPPNDLWWHARVGVDILETGRIPRSDVYSLTMAGQPYFYQNWLAEVIMGATLRMGGIRLLVLLRTLIMVGLFGAVLALCWWASGENRWATVAGTLTAILLGISNQAMRTQLFAYPLFIAVYVLLWRHRQGVGGRAIWMIPVLMAIWANVHGSFVLGLVLIWLVVGGELLRRTLERETSDPRARRRLVTLALVALVSSLAMLANPRGVEIIGYVDHLLGSSPVQNLATEWQPPHPTSGLGILFYPAVLGLFAVLALARPPVPLTDLILVLAFAWLGTTGVRHVVWYGLVSAPVLAEALPRLPWGSLRRWRGWLARGRWGRRFIYGDPRGYSGFRRIAVAALGLTLIAVAILFLLHGDDGTWMTDDTGREAVLFMERQGIRGRLFNEMIRGSYVIWRLGPEQPVFIDPRFEFYPLDHFEAYLDISRAEGDVAAQLGAYDFDLLLLGREVQDDLVAFVETRPAEWERIYADDDTVLYRRIQD